MGKSNKRKKYSGNSPGTWAQSINSKPGIEAQPKQTGIPPIRCPGAVSSSAKPQPQTEDSLSRPSAGYRGAFIDAAAVVAGTDRRAFGIRTRRTAGELFHHLPRIEGWVYGAEGNTKEPARPLPNAEISETQRVAWSEKTAKTSHFCASDDRTAAQGSRQQKSVRPF